jgi:sec-independent protein translocase protein TatB
MEILGIGPLEFIFILLIALIVLGPNDMVKAGRTIGRFLRRIVTSPNWRTLQDASKELRTLPNRLIREAGIEELQKEIPTADQISRNLGVEEVKEVRSQVTKEVDSLPKDMSDWITPPTIGSPEAPPTPSLPPDSSSHTEQE